MYPSSIRRELRYLARTPRWWYQRIRYGVSDRDTWNLDLYIATVVVNGLKRWRELGINSFPFRPVYDADGKELIGEDGSIVQWQDVLLQIQEGFEAATKIIDDINTPEESKVLAEKFDIGMKLFKEYYFHLWD